MNIPMLVHGVCYGQSMSSTEVQQQSTTRPAQLEPISPLQAFLIVSHMGFEVPRQNYNITRW